MAATRLPPDFKELLRLLNSARVEFLIVGGFAVAFYGYPRATGDLDLWIALDPENAARVSAALHQFGFPPSAVSATLFLKPGRIIRIGVPPVRVEFLTGISGVTFEECFARRTPAELDGVPTAFISRADLERNTRAAGRAKDKADLENLPD